MPHVELVAIVDVQIVDHLLRELEFIEAHVELLVQVEQSQSVGGATHLAGQRRLQLAHRLVGADVHHLHLVIKHNRHGKGRLRGQTHVRQWVEFTVDLLQLVVPGD